MNILTFDWEVTTHNKGSPFDYRNKAVCIGFKGAAQEPSCEFDSWFQAAKAVEAADVLVGFNAKFDLHWLRREGISFEDKRAWDCQVAEFIIEGQTNPYPSLQDTATKYGLGSKLDVIKTEYWDKGIQTDAIPREILSEYCIQDVNLTYQIYLKQQEYLADKPAMKRLISLACQDLLVLQEMEWNGLVYDEQLCKQREEQLAAELSTLQTQLAQIYPDVPINFGSGDQLSAFLYGGVVFQDGKEHVGFFKSGERKGQPKYKNITIEHKLPRLVEPLKNTELKKPGFWKTDEGTLRKLKGPAAKRFVGPLLEMARLEKLLSTYYKGLPDKNQEGHWPSGMIHGQFNQCVAATGRLSSSKPNLQNFAGECLDIFVTRF